ncbi:beta-taxilin isoform X2 [Thrips palmi]|uniref:Beta-taxilin isoform X2 n=1 Tax=Thrips palmi TaxID=161013 RepID=A0A6P9AAX5_THRPL|nr:beta-taxilin isoform X2 [Thrips palmi]
MEAVDNKGSEAISSLSLKEGSGTSPNTKGDSDKTAIENGGLNGSSEKKISQEKESVEKDEAKIPIKQSEPSGGKQGSNKSAEIVNKKSSREEKYSRRKDERGVDQVMKGLNSFETPQEKLDALVKKYSEIYDENRKLQTQTKNYERRLIQVEREKDSAQSEHSKSVLARSRLEGLCRELQRQNRAIKEESVLKIREEEEKRKEVSNKFQSTLAEITSLMQQNNEKNSKLRDDNIEMTTKFKSVCEQYELRVQQVEKISKQMQLEAQLADAKLAKAHLEAKAEKENMLREKQDLLLELTQCQVRAREQEKTELKLREQVELYTNKYDEFQTALSRSNEVFGGFKDEMDKMSKKIVKLEKETSTWKLRWEKSHQALLEMATDKQQRDAELSLANRQLNQLHKLCRTLTEERAKLMAQINAIGANTPTDTAKEDKLAADIAEDRRKLNDTLDSLQSVILERELLHKQQQLEKQQQQLQVELQKQLAAEPKAEACEVKTAEKSLDSKTSCSKPAETKTPVGKNAEQSKKKGKKQKSGRQPSDKPTPSEELKPELKEGTASPSGNTDLSNGNPSQAELTTSAEQNQVEAQGSSAPVTDLSLSDSLPVSTPPITEPEILSQVQPKIKDVTEKLIVASPDSKPLSAQEPKASKEAVAPSNSACNVPSAPATFSYAAALGSKPAEPLAEKNQIEKTPAEPVVEKSQIEKTPAEKVVEQSQIEETPAEKVVEKSQIEKTPTEQVKEKSEIEKAPTDPVKEKSQIEKTPTEPVKEKSQIEKTPTEPAKEKGQIEKTPTEPVKEKGQIEKTPTEPVKEKSQIEKTEKVLAVPHTDAAVPETVNTVSATVDAVNGVPKPKAMEAAITPSEEVTAAVPLVVSPPKKSKESGRKRKK